MNVKTISILFILVGLAMMAFGLLMDTSVATGHGLDRVNNLGLMSEKQNYLILGGIAFIAGIILYALHQLKQTNEEKQAELDSLERRKQRSAAITNSIRNRVSESWSNFDKGEKTVAIATLLCIFSLMLPWLHLEVALLRQTAKLLGQDYSGENSWITIPELITLALLWAYPVAMLISNKKINLVGGLICAVSTVFWLFYVAYKLNDLGKLMADMVEDTTISFGYGLYLSFAASILLIVGILLSAWKAADDEEKQKQGNS